MEYMINFGISFIDGISDLSAWLLKTVDLGSLGTWTVGNLVCGGGLVVILGYLLIKFVIPTS